MTGMIKLTQHTHSAPESPDVYVKACEIVRVQSARNGATVVELKDGNYDV